MFTPPLSPPSGHCTCISLANILFTGLMAAYKKLIFEKIHNTKAVNFLDVTLDLASESFKPYRKPNDRPLYVHVESNHPQSVIKQIPKGINKRLSSISSSKEHFDRAAPAYQKALDESSHQFNLNKEDPQQTRRDKTQDSTRLELLLSFL